MKQNISRVKTITLCLLAGLNSCLHLQGSNLDGTSSLVYKNQHHVFSDGESARGYVRMNGGFTIKPGATATLDTVVSVSGSIDLRETGQMQLLKDLELDSGLTWSNGGSIKGRGHALILNDTLSIPASKVIHISSDTVIDGKKGQVLLLNDHAQIFVDNNATLTLRNVVVRNTKNNPLNPCLKVGGNSGNLALDNVVLAMANDIAFAHGQLYIHNDVTFSGTSAFIYQSTSPSFVAPSGILKFDIGTTFSFAPNTTIENLFVLQNKTSILHLNGCTLNTTSSGMRLTKGQLIIDNKVILNSNISGGSMLSTLSSLTSQDYGSHIFPTSIRSVAWHPGGSILAIAGLRAESNTGQFVPADLLRLYTFDGSTLTPLTSQDYGNMLFSIAWSPDGKTLAIAGYDPTSGVGGFANTHELRLYSFDGATLTPLTSQEYGYAVYSISWSPDGKYLAIGGEAPTTFGGGANTDELHVYSFNGSALTAITTQNYGTAISRLTSIAWSPDGKTLAIGGEAPTSTGGFTNTDELRLYSFNGSTLTALSSQDYGSRVNSIVWNPDATVLAIGGTGAINGAGGFTNNDLLRLYSFNGSTLTTLTSHGYASPGPGTIHTIAWNPTGTILTIAGAAPSSGFGGFANIDELRLYNFDGSTLTPLTSKSYGSPGNFITALTWNPAGTVVTIGGGSPSSGGGFTNNDELRLYSGNFIQESFPQALSRSIVLGNSALGASANLNVEILGAAHVTINGIVNDDSV